MSSMSEVLFFIVGGWRRAVKAVAFAIAAGA
jgi:hypothetical protein